MNNITRLQQHAKHYGDTGVAVIGAGYVGTGIVQVLANTPTVHPSVIVARDTAKAVNAFVSIGYKKADIVVSNDVATLNNAIAQGTPAITEQVELVTELLIGIVVEATGAINYAAQVITASLNARKHVISFNAEADALLGWSFHRTAETNGVIYTIADGDQPGVMLRLQQEIESMGFEASALINCKRHLNLYQNPETGSGFTARDTTSAKMTTSFGDGTKMQVENAVVANATGMLPIKRGMTGFKTSQEAAAKDIAAGLDDGCYVDFTWGGDFGAGVAAMGRHPDYALHKKAMSLYKMGDGPDYFFFKPYHLVHLELPATLCSILVDGEPLGRVSEPHVCEVLAIAKKPLNADDDLDGIGGFAAYGHIDTVDGAEGCLPIGLLDFAQLNSAVEIDQPIPLASVTLDLSIVAVQMWLAQQKHWGRNTAYLQSIEALVPSNTDVKSIPVSGHAV